MTIRDGLLSTVTCDNCGHLWLVIGSPANIRRQVEYIGGAVVGNRHYCSGCVRHLEQMRIMEVARCCTK
jgi:hypothetical protein